MDEEFLIFIGVYQKFFVFQPHSMIEVVNR